MKFVPWFFGLLVAATIAAFFVSQKLKGTPPAVQSVIRTDEFSPGPNGLRDEAVFSFRLKRDDTVTVTVVDAQGTPIQKIAENLPVKAYKRVRLTWNGMRDNGKTAPDGTYRYRVGLAKQGRSVTVPVAVKLDNTAPKPVVTAIGPERGKGPEVLPLTGSKKLTVKFKGPTEHTPEALIYRVRSNAKPELVQQVKGKAGQSQIEWDGKVDGRRPDVGNYLIAIKVRDRAGNTGISLREPLKAKGSIPGRSGVVVRPLAIKWLPKTLEAGQETLFKIDSRGQKYRYTVRRVGTDRVSREGKGSGGVLRFRAPNEGFSSLYLLKVIVGENTVTVPIPVQARRKQKVLMVLPGATWQGSNEVDDDGDGSVDTLSTKTEIKQRRFTYDSSLLSLVNKQSVPFIEFINSKGYRYDITTDLDLASGSGPELSNYRAVVFPGQVKWFPTKLGSKVRKYVLDGGKAFIPSGGSFKEKVTVTAAKLSKPVPIGERDIFGVEAELIKPKRPVDITAFTGDRIDLFQGTDGLYPNWSEYEQVTSFDRRSERLAAAGVSEAEPVVVGFKLGQGFVVRTGLPEWNTRLTAGSKEAQTTARVWRLIVKSKVEEVG